ncbi:MAG: outer membrane lipoprotein-sorting protein [Verrucomicrobia bacterium]|nr:outer membrane lipoprotein-sorting protein [Verrucomicrobiota bacterium]
MITKLRPAATLICLGLAGVFALESPAADAPPDASAIMRRVAANRPALPLALDATLKVERRVADVYDLKILINGDPRQVRTVYRVTGPADDKACGTAILMIEGGDLWRQTPGESAARKLEATDRPQPFLGGDFSYEDLDFAFLRWPNQKFIKDSRRLGFDCWVIESTPGPGIASQYSRVLSWVDKNYMAAVIAEAYDPKGKLMKNLTVQSVRKLDDKGHYIPGQITLENVRTKSRTVLRVDEDHPGPKDAALFEPETFFSQAKRPSQTKD